MTQQRSLVVVAVPVRTHARRLQQRDDVAHRHFVLGHDKEEQDEMFPKVRKTKLDLVALGEQMKALRIELEESLV